jgi:hypothetical protein
MWLVKDRQDEKKMLNAVGMEDEDAQMETRKEEEEE